MSFAKCAHLIYKKKKKLVYFLHFFADGQLCYKIIEIVANVRMKWRILFADDELRGDLEY